MLHLSHEKKQPYFPWNTGCLIGILIMRLLYLILSSTENWVVQLPIYPKQPVFFITTIYKRSVFAQLRPQQPRWHFPRKTRKKTKNPLQNGSTNFTPRCPKGWKSINCYFSWTLSWKRKTFFQPKTNKNPDWTKIDVVLFENKTTRVCWSQIPVVGASPSSNLSCNKFNIFWPRSLRTTQYCWCSVMRPPCHGAAM